MDFVQVIQFEGNIDDLVWKSPVEDFNTSSVLICDETHEALVLVNGVQYGIYSAGRHVLETPNIPIAKEIINIPSDGNTTFPCKVFFVNKLHQMSMNWGIPGTIYLEDPTYHIFLHIGAHGGVNFYVKETAKFLEKLVGFRDKFDPNELVDPDNGMFRSVINKAVTSAIAKIMTTARVSYFMMAEQLYEISDFIRDYQLAPIFDEYGIGIKEFVIEGLVTQEDDLAVVKDARSKEAARKIQGYDWQGEQKAAIMMAFASNQGTAGALGGAMGGFMAGGMMAGSLTDMGRSVLSGNGLNPGSEPQLENNGNNNAPIINGGSGLDVVSFMNNGGKSFHQPSTQPAAQPQQPVPGMAPISAGPAVGVDICSVCGAQLAPGKKFCTKCGTPVGAPKKKFCPKCGTEAEADDMFCGSCGHKF